ncbi:TonB-dependent receptor [Azoarcus sp. PA01]|nr:TonB-dependent receptor [Azoarcus sp. PA01]
MSATAGSRLALAAAMISGGSAMAQEAIPPQAGDAALEPVAVIGTTLLPGIGLPREQIPANVQTVPAQSLREAGGVSLAESLQRRLPSINVNEMQGNPYQADLNYRGFSASPLLGTPQGLSVFLDGVRVNEPFGDVVNWDLIPRSAIASMTLVPGSNPLYGLNTLGGALALETKRGDTHPGGEFELYGGAFGRRGGAIQHGGTRNDASWFLAAEGLEEDGWRDHSPTDVGQVFGKFGLTAGVTDLALTLAHARTDLVGNGVVPESLLRDEGREAVFTHPDQTRNRGTLMALSGTHWLNDSDQLSGTAYVRRTHTRTLNGDLEDDFESGDDENGALNRTATRQNAAGVALQGSRVAGAHQFALGVSHDRGRSNFRQSEQEGELDDSRGVEPTDDEEEVNELLGRTRTTSVYVTDSVALTPAVQMTGSLRYNHTRVVSDDRLRPNEPGNLDGDFTYRKLNPALGFTWQTSPNLTAYGGFSQGNRAPSPIELGCADPENACSLPNAMAADPFLEQVVTRTFEFGLRGRLSDDIRWNAGAFRSTNHDDILFVGTGGSLGYFTNFGKTRRDGIELGLEGETGALDWQLHYSYLRAMFRSSACVLAENNSTAGGGGCGEDEIRVSSGDRLPGLPAHSLKLAVSWRATEALRIGADVVGYSKQYARGNENNAHRADDEFGGRGKVAGYALVNMSADYRLGGGWMLFGRIDNVFDKRYATGGVLAENPFVGPGSAFAADADAWRSEQAVAPGAPRAAWLGLRYRWGG